MTQPCRLCLKLKATQCQPCPRLKLILTSCVISQNWMAEQISKGGPNPLILCNLSQVFSFLPPMKAGVPSEKGARYNPCAHTGSPKGGERPLRAGLGPCTVCIHVYHLHTNIQVRIYRKPAHICAQRGWGVPFFGKHMPNLSNAGNIIDLW